MKRWISALTIALMLSLLLVPGVQAAEAPRPLITLSTDKSSVAPGERVVLTVKITGAVDVYGSSVDVYYDSNLLVPVLPVGGVTTATTAMGIVTTALTESEYFTSMPSNPQTGISRQSLVAVRVGQVAGATEAGERVLGTMEFEGRFSGPDTLPVTFSLAPSSVHVKLVNSLGDPIAPDFGPAVTVNVGIPTALTITAPSPGTMVTTSNPTISGTAPAGASVTVSIGAQSKQVTANASGTFVANFSGIADGPQSVSATTGTASAGPVSFYIDTVAPQVAMNPLPSPVVTPLTVTGTFVEANIDKIYVLVNPTGGALPTTDDEAVVNAAAGTYTKTVALNGGANLIKVIAIDRAGRSATATATADFTTPFLRLLTDKTHYLPGETVTITGEVQNAPSTMHGLTAEITFADSLLEFMGASFDGSIFGGPDNDWSSATTSVYVDIYNADAPSASTGNAFTLIFKVKSTAPVTSTTVGVAGVHFLNTPTTSIPHGESQPATVQITRLGAISGVVELQARTSNAGAVVEVRSGSTVVKSTTTNAAGEFSITDLAVGTYDLVITRTSYLSAKIQSVPVTVGETTTLDHLDIFLIPGNIADRSDARDVIFLEDLAVLARAWQTTAGSPNWNPLADLDDNGAVNLLDLSYLSLNWAKGGALSSQPAPGTVIPYQNQ